MDAVDDRPRWARRSRRGIPTLAEYKKKNRDDQITEIGRLTELRARLHNPTMGLLFTALGVAVAAIALAMSIIPSDAPSLEVTHCRPVEGGFDCWRPFDPDTAVAALEAAYVPLILAGGILAAAGMGTSLYLVASQRVPWIEQRLEEYKLHLKPEREDSWQMEFGWMTIPIKPLSGEPNGGGRRSTRR